jgi:Lsr2
MAQRVQIILEDDFDGGTAEETVSFALDGTEYEIDLSAKNAAGLRDAMSPWLGHARKTGGRRKRGTAAKASSNSSTSDIRAWAQAHGHEVSSRGRVSAEVREAYEKAHA